MILFAFCQIQMASGCRQRFIYISDEYGQKGQDQLMKGSFNKLNLHAHVKAAILAPAQVPQPAAVLYALNVVAKRMPKSTNATLQPAQM